MQKSISVLFLLLVLFSCGSDGGMDPNLEKPFFDLRAYMTEEIERLEGYPLTVEKSITLNGTTETQKLTDLNYANDLRVFREADINRNAWIDKYTTEVDDLSGSHKVTTYQAQDSSLQTQRLVVEEDQGVVTRVGIRRKTGTVLSDGEHWLEYLPARGYSVKTKQANRFGNDVDALIEVSW
ncbi:MAG: hypothetical protein AAGA62_00160 [Bacteroidota bacterium]